MAAVKTMTTQNLHAKKEQREEFARTQESEQNADPNRNDQETSPTPNSTDASASPAERTERPPRDTDEGALERTEPDAAPEDLIVTDGGAHAPEGDNDPEVPADFLPRIVVPAVGNAAADAHTPPTVDVTQLVEQSPPGPPFNAPATDSARRQPANLDLSSFHVDTGDEESLGEGRAEEVIEEFEAHRGADMDPQTERLLNAQQDAADLGARANTRAASNHGPDPADPYRGTVPAGYSVQHAYEEGDGQFGADEQKNATKRLVSWAEQLRGERPYTFLLNPVGNENRWRYHIFFLVKD